ncbi:ADP-ribosylglycohydrolase family protein [Sphingobacterium sp.]|uniref:ADP-ribosylglycohydrolase family protein n=1 Tax=Sphingobacterium sp. TaxID=341027 RepID=UPI0028968CEE|nr:ADP-ribosylglycohydrolase family protein [Sphingobacterium sp.]
MKKNFFIPKIALALCAVCITAASYAQNSLPKQAKIKPEVLKDKLKGGWAGQVIGVTFGGPTEFKYNGTYIPDNKVIPWYDGYIKKTMIEWPGLYDDVYMDLTFVDVIEKKGVDAPAADFANAFANADYVLWHANQAARYNILNGVMPPESGHWLNNPHADDIDYQIEADFAGLMNPGMPNSASDISDKVGHIMNYGDGWYGGVYVGALYTIAYISDDVNFVVKEALKTVPAQSDFYKCIADVIKWHAQYPKDWKQTWFELQKKWSEAHGCPDGAFGPFNIDAKINAAYIVLGLLYGEGDFTKTLEISTRAGQDSDCNPSNAGGVLGTILGYDKIPAYWKMGLKEAEDINFKYTDISLNKVYEIGYKHAIQMIKKNGGKVGANEIVINVQQPKAVRYEKAFEGTYPIERMSLGSRKLTSEHAFDFTGTGIVIKGNAAKDANIKEEYTLELTVYIDGKEVERTKMPTDYKTRKHEIFWKYQLPKGKHNVKVVVTNPKKGYHIRMTDAIIYSDAPIDGIHFHEGKHD